MAVGRIIKVRGKQLFLTRNVLEGHGRFAMLCAKGVANGCYQNYAILLDVLEVLTAFEEAVEEQEVQS